MNGDDKREELESSLHLFQPPRYRAGTGSWQRSFEETLGDGGETLEWDLSTIASILGHAYPLGDRTLIRQITRRPWLSRASGSDDPVLEPVPVHDTFADSTERIGDELLRRLFDEARLVCAGRKEIYILLSGGLDSRIVAGVLGRLHRDGELRAPPIAVTWGLENSRDVVYGQRAAELLGFDWKHAPATPEILAENITASARRLGGLVPPHHLHRMLWFADASPDALVVAGSWGDGVGRAEYSGKHILELSPIQINDAFGLVRPAVLGTAMAGAQADLDALRSRTPGAFRHSICEHECQAHYMRGMIGQSMSVINDFCTLYQLFTHPEVYSYMWSVHPSLRIDSVYAELLEKLNRKLARMPWARTNRAMREPTEGASDTALRGYHDYSGWCAGPMRELLASRLDPEWFAETGIFDPSAISRVLAATGRGETRLDGHGRGAYEVALWLATFRGFAERLADLGVKPILGDVAPLRERKSPVETKVNPIRAKLRKSPTIYAFYKRMRRNVLSRRAMKSLPAKRRDSASG